MKVKRMNASSKKTNKAIREAFAELLKEKGDLSHITATDLSKKADITRATFYTHYDSVYEIAQELQDETLNILMNDMTSIKTIEDIENYIDIVFDYLKNNENIYHMIFSSNDPLMFASRLNKYMTKEISNILKNTNNKDLLLAISFFCDGSINLIIKYFRNEINITLDETKSFIKTMAKTILKEY